MPDGFCRPQGHKYSGDGGRGAAPAGLNAMPGCPAPPAQGTIWGHQQWDGHMALKWHIFDDLLWQDGAGSHNARGCVAGSSLRRDGSCSGWPGEQLMPCTLMEPWCHCSVIMMAGDDGNTDLGGSSAPTFWEGVVSWKRWLPQQGTPRSRHLSPGQLAPADET